MSEKNNQILELHAYDITINDQAIDEKGDEHTEIQLWAFNKNSEPLLARVRDFPVFCKIELPAIISRSGYIVQWDADLCQDLYRCIKRILE